MEYSFPLRRKISEKGFISIVVFLSALFCILGFGTLSDFWEEGKIVIPQGYITTFIVVVLIALLGLVLAYAVTYMIIARPYKRKVYFNKEGVSYKHKDIFISWEDVKEIAIVSGRGGTNLTIYTNLNEKIKLKDMFQQRSSTKILLEWDKEMTPMLMEFWDNDIAGFTHYKNKNDNSLALAFVFEGIVALFFLAAMLTI